MELDGGGGGVGFICLSDQCYGSGMFIPDPTTKKESEATNFLSQWTKNWSIFNQNYVFMSSQKHVLGIRDPEKTHPRFRGRKGPAFEILCPTDDVTKHAFGIGSTLSRSWGCAWRATRWYSAATCATTKIPGPTSATSTSPPVAGPWASRRYHYPLGSVYTFCLTVIRTFLFFSLVLSFFFSLFVWWARFFPIYRPLLKTVPSRSY
jgi:hypothetical protein